MALSIKKADHCDLIDRISDLPCNVIDDILEHLKIGDLVRTSILSRKWRYMWTSVTRLEFDRDFFKRYEHLDLDDCDPGISRIITQVLFQHNGPVHKFTVYIPWKFDYIITSEDLRTWILFLSTRRIKYIDLVNYATDPIEMPFDVFSCQELTCLKLSGLYIAVRPNLFVLKSLLVLHLTLITFESNALQSLISGCPLLEELSISFCNGFECIDLSAPTVKVLRIEGDDDIESICLKKTNNPIDLTIVAERDSVSGLIKSLPKIQRLAMVSWVRKILFADMVPPSLLINSFSTLEYLKWTSMDLNDKGELLYIVSVIKSASNLVHLIIESYIDVDNATQVPDHLEEMECISCCLSQLQTVEIYVKASCHNAMCLIEFILANSPSLKTLAFDVYGLSSELSDEPMRLSIAQDLSCMERASEEAVVEFYYR